MSKTATKSTKKNEGKTADAKAVKGDPSLWGPKLCEIPAGIAVLGTAPEDASGQSDESQYVYPTSSFMMDETPVTRAQWKAVMGTDPCPDQPEDAPVTNVSWFDAVRYCNKRSELEGLVPMYDITGPNDAPVVARVKLGYRLPTESEWEYACRAETTGPRYGELDEIAVYGQSKIAPVKTKKPNKWGLYDMIGNVWEWCEDPYSADRSAMVEKGLWSSVCLGGRVDGGVGKDAPQTEPDTEK